MWSFLVSLSAYLSGRFAKDSTHEERDINERFFFQKMVVGYTLTDAVGPHKPSGRLGYCWIAISFSGDATKPQLTWRRCQK
jgi:hypothetical protein